MHFVPLPACRLSTNVANTMPRRTIDQAALAKSTGKSSNSRNMRAGLHIASRRT
jgi:hypothetical protein